MHRAVALALAALAAGCAELGVVGDGTTVSLGRVSEGVLIDGVELPSEGEGYWTPPRWRQRGNRWGTDELVTLITSVGRVVATELPGQRLGVADLAQPGGGPGPYHRSHQTGLDADLLFFATDLRGKPVPLTAMRHFGEDGFTVDGAPRLRFDVRRTWIVVRALASSTDVAIEHLFIYAPLRAMLLDHARELGEPESLIAWAGELLSQPTDSAPHDDHLHLRIRCAASDLGCADSSRPRVKKAREVIAGSIAARLAAHPIIGAPWLHGPHW